MQYLGPFILSIWFIMTTIIYISTFTKKKRRKFSYKSLFFGSLAWEKNSRNWLLILGLFSLIILNPITDTFIFLMILGSYIAVTSCLNLFLHHGNRRQTILIIILSFFLILAAFYPLLSNFK